ncbi:hypothetical protein [Microvirga zambiensis]|uniref:hypothetical protein n=1 Tax=Microvirga zambiensis TaxID=1402137 RepID=UPI00191F4BA9|nr:hypothetical protein [Microvirga zambiensis]
MRRIIARLAPLPLAVSTALAQSTPPAQSLPTGADDSAVLLWIAAFSALAVLAFWYVARSRHHP